MRRICPRRSGLSLQKKPSNHLEEEKQMTMATTIGASSDRTSDWEAVHWPKVRRDVRRLQLRIAKATRAEKHGRVKALQWLLTHSRSAKLLAVRRVTGNKGARTPGIDNKRWRTDGKRTDSSRRGRGHHRAGSSRHCWPTSRWTEWKRRSAAGLESDTIR